MAAQTMTRRSRPRHGWAFKANVALAEVRGQKTLSELAEQFDCSPEPDSAWSEQLLKGASDVLAMARNLLRPRQLWT